MAKIDPTELLEFFGRGVKARRKELRITQVELGKRVGVSASQISRTERGVYGDIPLTLFVRICQALGRSPSSVFKWFP